MKRFILLNLLVTCVALAGSAQAADKKIERLYGSKCAACHGKDGKAQTEKGKKMKVRDLASAEVQKSTDAEMKKAISEGLKTEHGEMEGFKDDIKDPELDALVKYMREFKK